MVRYIVGAILTLAILSPVVAQDPLPRSLVGFFAPGTQVGIIGSETGSFRVVIYSPSDFAIRADARNLSFDELAAKYESVAKARDDKLKQRADSGETGTPEFNVLLTNNELLCKIVHVGDDYLLVKMADHDQYRMVYPLGQLTSIHWAGPLPLRTTIRYSDGTK
jgi:hypothetical protein